MCLVLAAFLAGSGLNVAHYFVPEGSFILNNNGCLINSGDKHSVTTSLSVRVEKPLTSRTGLLCSRIISMDAFGVVANTPLAVGD